MVARFRAYPKLTLLVPLILWLGYGQFATFLHFKADFKIFVHDFSDPTTADQLFYNLYYVIGILSLSFLMSCYIRGIFDSIDIRLKRSIVTLILWDAAWELIDIIVWNNNHDYKGLLYQHGILLASGCYSYLKYYRKWKL